MPKIPCFKNTNLPELEARFNAATTDDMPEAEQRAIAARLAADYHKQLHNRATTLRKAMGLKTPAYNAPKIEEVAPVIPTAVGPVAMFSKDGKVLGMVLNGEVFLNPDEVQADTPLHEIGGHVLATWARTNQPELYAKMIELGRSAPQGLINQIRQAYPELTEGSVEFYEEVFATALGQYNVDRTVQAAQEDQGFWNRLRTLVKNLYDAMVNSLVDAGVVTPQATFDVNEFQDMNLSDFSNMVGEKLLSGRRLSAPTAVDPRGFADYGLLREEDYIRDKYKNIIGVRPQVLRDIMNEKVAIRNEAVAAGNYMLAPDGSPTLLSEDQWLTVRTKRFQQFDGGKVLKASNGEPKVFFHGTNAEFTSFRDDRPAYFADVPEYSDAYARRWYWQDYANGGNMMPVFLKAENPFDITKPQHRAIYDRAYDGGFVQGLVGDGTLDYLDVQGLLNYFNATNQTFDGIVNILETQAPVGNTMKSVAILQPKNIKSAISNTTFSNESNDVRFQRIGVRSNLTPLQQENLEIAERMASEGVPNNDIFLATGWFRDNADGEWRYELPNDNVRFNFNNTNSAFGVYWILRKDFDNMDDEGVEKWLSNYPPDVAIEVKRLLYYRVITLGNLLDYPELYQAHPDLAVTRVRLHNPEVLGAWGQYNPDTDEIDLASRTDTAEMYLTLRHEVQHALQHRLGFENGGDTVLAKKYLDKKVAGLKRQIKSYENTDVDTTPLQEEVKDLTDRREYWISHFYRNIAGEREAFAVKDRAKLPDELRVLVPPYQAPAETAILYKDNQAVKPTTATEKIDDRQRIELEAKNEKIFFTPSGEVAFDKIVALKQRLKEEWAALGSVGVMADNVEQFRKSMKIYKTLLDLALAYAERGVGNMGAFFTDRKVLDAIQDGLGMPIRTYADIPASIRKKIDTILLMNSRQLAIVKQVVDTTLKSKAKDLEKRFNTALKQAQPEIEAANKSAIPDNKVRSKLRLDEEGTFAPLPVDRKFQADLDQYVQRLAQWKPVTGGMTAQQARLTNEKVGFFIDESFYERESTRLALSNQSMQFLINEGIAKFGNRFDAVVLEVLKSPLLAERDAGTGNDAEETNLEAKTSFFTNIMQLSPFPRDVMNKIAETRAKSATQVSNIMNLRRIINGGAQLSINLIKDTLGDIGNRLQTIQKAVADELKSNNFDSPIGEEVQLRYEEGIDEAQAVVEEEPDDTGRKAKPLTDKEINAGAKNAMAKLKSKTGKKTKKEIIQELNDQINKAKC